MSIAQQTGRTERLVNLFGDAGIDAILVTDLINLRYLTGFVGTNGLAVIGHSTRVFATDFRYVEQAAGQVDASFDRRELPRNLLSSIDELLPAGQLRLGFETSLPVRIYNRLQEALPERIELVPAEGLVERLRAVKDPGEVLRMREAAQLADAALQQVLEEGLVGRTERDVALSLSIAMYRLGAPHPSFETIIAAGAHGALPHSAPRDEQIGRGELVVIDWGAQLDGYCSDCTRTVATGEAGAEAREIYELVLQAQLAALGAVRAGAGEREVDAVARRLIEAGGHGDDFGHGLGHGVGLDIHEDPRLSQTAEGELEAGNVVTIEPGVYLPGKFGVRIEDLVVVTDDGCEILSSLSKDLIIAD
jgi:Xaa-Pro aminopeptidase